MKVRAGKLSDGEREILIESNRTSRTVLVATLASSEGPGQMVGSCQGWVHDAFRLGGWTFSTTIPWESAIKVWWRDETPDEAEVDAMLRDAPPADQGEGDQ